MPSVDTLLVPLSDSRYAVRCAAQPELPLAYEPYLYLRPEHLALQRPAGTEWCFYLEDRHAGHTLGQWHLLVTDAQAHSPWQAPLGGVQVASGVSGATVSLFVAAVHAALRAAGIRQVHIRCAPFSYAPTTSGVVTQLLQELGYRVALAEINNTLPLHLPFEQRLHSSERRRLRKCERHGLRVEQETPLFLPLAYEFIRQCREEKGQSLSLSLERLQELFRLFPNDHFLFSVRDAIGAWAAMTILIRVSDQVLYNFYPASPLAWNTFSPAILLTQGLHAFGQASGYQLLDLGTSTLPDGPNTSLLQFKRHLGGVPGLRLTLTYDGA